MRRMLAVMLMLFLALGSACAQESFPAALFEAKTLSDLSGGPLGFLGEFESEGFWQGEAEYLNDDRLYANVFTSADNEKIDMMDVYLSVSCDTAVEVFAGIRAAFVEHFGTPAEEMHMYVENGGMDMRSFHEPVKEEDILNGTADPQIWKILAWSLPDEELVRITIAHEDAEQTVFILSFDLTGEF